MTDKSPCAIRTRAKEAEEAEEAIEHARLAEIAAILRNGAVSRRDPLGYDRHWNRYWLIGNSEHAKGNLSWPASRIQ